MEKGGRHQPAPFRLSQYSCCVHFVPPGFKLKAMQTRVAACTKQTLPGRPATTQDHATEWLKTRPSGADGLGANPSPPPPNLMGVKRRGLDLFPVENARRYRRS